MGRGQWEGRGAKARGRRRGKTGDFTDGYDLPVQRRVPQLVYTNKIGICLFICSPMDGQTTRPNGLKFGG